MYFKDQKSYEEHYSPVQRKARSEILRKARETAVSAAHEQFIDGDDDGARTKLFDAGIKDDGISYFMSTWTDDCKS